MAVLLPVGVAAAVIAYVLLVFWLVVRNMQASFLMLAGLRIVVGIIIGLATGFGLVPNAAGAVLGLALALGLWYGAALIRGRLGKWSVLARRYRRDAEFSGKRWNLKTGLVGIPTPQGMGHPLVAMQSWLTLGTDQGGLYLSHNLLGRPFHPSIYVPWKDIKAARPENVLGWFKKLYVDLALGPDGVVLRLDRRFATRLLAQHGPAVPPVMDPAVAAPVGRTARAARV
jgi:hypothetical protein